MNIKQLLPGLTVLAAILLMLGIFIPAVSASSSSTTLKVDILKHEPYPAEIGEYVSVWVKIDNFASQRSDDVTIELVPEYPFYLDSPRNAQKNFGILPPTSTGIHEFRLFVDEDARPGVGTIKVRYQGESGGAWIEESFDIRVGTDTFDSRGTLELVSARTEPSVLMPGDIGTVILEMRNSASGQTIVLDGTEYDTNARIQAASLAGNGFIEVLSDSYRGDGVLGPGDIINIHYTVEVDEDAPVGTHLIGFSLIGSSHSYNANWQVPVRIDSQSSLKVIPSGSLELENGVGTLEFDVANVHSAALSSVSVRLESDDMRFSPAEYFIGTMESDELFTIDIKAESISNSNSTNTVNVIASYRNGPNNHEYTVDTLEVRSVDAPGGSGAALIVFLLVVVAAGAGAFYYRKKKMNKNEKEEE
ncbi:conserved hypothetical protein [Methanosalsum zhilinae DSM 4017]|uniref:CARDB domain-containing protein n=1 Tax=Methanosalsum zhilinae (strain DSM 4017 / NBRC 107636 / OCM 62 / WeN5) TaxID=679901 RepID=F7XLL8_METZD|nr:COG1361 S-layer family protein [Methanosalsum zhilinae]AEH60837.1 conserved hypothetical protein [Methanosalsum zhilinae DSM 4017]